MDSLMNEAIYQTMAARRNIRGNMPEINTAQPEIFPVMTAQNVNHYVAMGYVPMQQWEEIYDINTAFHEGTLFPSLNKPFFGKGK